MAAIPNGDAEKNSGSSNWDISVHLPVWVLDTEKNAIEGRIEEWTNQFESCGADIPSLALGLQKPLRPLWISQKTRIWLNEVPEHELWDFTPIILVSASAAVATQRMSSEFSWHYIPGAGDDEESWARGLTPTLFWKHSYDLLDGGPDLCNQLVADIVEKDRVYRAQRGEHSPQITTKPLKCSSHDAPYCNGDHSTIMQPLNSDPSTVTATDTQYANDGHLLFWIGTSNLAVSSTLQGIMINWTLVIFPVLLFVFFVNYMSPRYNVIILCIYLCMFDMQLQNIVCQPAIVCNYVASNLLFRIILCFSLFF